MAREVLIIDDDDAFSDLAARVVTSWGHVVVGRASTASEGLACASAMRPEVVLVDIGLPDGNGFSVTEKLAAMPWPMCVVLISSDSDAANGSAALRSGATGFVPKHHLAGAAMRDFIEGS